MHELQVGLKSTLRKGPRGDSLEGILTPSDEFEYWINLANDYNIDQSSQERAKEFADEFSKINRQWEEVIAGNIAELQDLLEQTQDVLDIVWKKPAAPAYPQDRMGHLIKVLSETVVRKVQASFGKADLWGVEFSDIKVKLREGLRVCERWTEIV